MRFANYITEHNQTLIQCPILEVEYRKNGQQIYSIEDNELVRTKFCRILKTLFQTLSGCWIRSNTLEIQTLSLILRALVEFVCALKFVCIRSIRPSCPRF